MKRLLLVLVRAYRVALSPLLMPRCRFLPTCSDYALQAIERHGALVGGWLAIARLLRCNPFHPGGIDEVPERPQAGLARAARRSGRVGRRHACACHPAAPAAPPGSSAPSIHPPTGQG